MKELDLESAKKKLAVVGEFKTFLMRGNVVDLAVGVVIGAAFGKIVSSLVADVIMPPVSKITGGIDFANLFIRLDSSKHLPDGGPIKTLAEAKTAAMPVIAYGQFLTNVVDFLIVAFCIFMMIKFINKLKKPAPPAPPEPTAQEKLLIEIRDLLKARV
jgi:large conductance mechanosensitive channel